MIMLGTKSPRLGWASALATLSLSAVLLPLTPSWAQKPAAEPQTAVFAYEVAAEPQTAVFAYEVKDDDAAKAADESRAEKVRVVVGTNDEIEQVQADSLDKAIELIKQKIAALANQGGGSDKQCGTGQGPGKGRGRPPACKGQDLQLPGVHGAGEAGRRKTLGPETRNRGRGTVPAHLREEGSDRQGQITR